MHEQLFYNDDGTTSGKFVVFAKRKVEQFCISQFSPVLIAETNIWQLDTPFGVWASQSHCQKQLSWFDVRQKSCCSSYSVCSLCKELFNHVIISRISRKEILLNVMCVLCRGVYCFYPVIQDESSVRKIYSHTMYHTDRILLPLDAKPLTSKKKKITI